ncbi:glycosyltransferase [Winogradskyella aurantiaca]|uniref:glycosyltransferase n=1 Tax=Winogradskyella aurantiaca TaxID=2219558 RepID=UPI000E1E0E4D|nr:glycosyltransferase [Winogradskyella aurantiaca]
MPWLSIVFWVFVGVVVCQMAFFLVFLLYYALKNTSDLKPGNTLPLSVIVCAKNEAQNLKTNIPLLLEQSYQNFELILVNDSSSDETLAIMEGFADINPNVKVVNVENVESFWGNKKYALTLGIKAATKSYLVFTDADCKPTSNRWLSHISGSFSKTKRIVLGYGSYQRYKGSLINALIRFETLLTAIQYFSYARIGLPYMGVGRNLAYHRDVFFENSGYMKHMDIMSGDDDLFVNSVATRTNVAIIDHPDSITVSKPKNNWKEWIAQKRRHVSTASYYKPIHQLVLGMFYTSQLMFILLSVLLLSFLFRWEIVLTLILFRFCLSILTYVKSASKLNEHGITFLLPVLEVTLIISQFFIFIANLISKPKHWN